MTHQVFFIRIILQVQPCQSLYSLCSIYSSKDRNKKTARQWAMAVGGQKANLIYLLRGAGGGRQNCRLFFIQHSTHRRKKYNINVGLIYFLFSMATIGRVLSSGSKA